jgi:uncharacterized protein (TIGR01777 family)
MTILITGGTGLIGRAVVQSLLDQGVRPRVVTRRPHRALEFFDNRVTAYEWHPRSEPLPAVALDGVERVLHLMGEPLLGPMSRDKRSRIAASRGVGTRRLIEALARRPTHVVVASSAAVYGCGEGPPVTETSSVRRPRDKVALALLACEEAAEQMRDSGAIVTHVRLGSVVAPGGFTEPLRRLHERGLTWRDTHPDAAVPAIDQVDAVALLTWLVLSRPVAGPVHAVAPEPLRSSDLKQLLVQTSSRRTRAQLPRWLLRRTLGLAADLLYSRQRIVPRRALDAGFVFARPDPLESVRILLAEPVARAPAPRASLLGGALQRT